MKAVGTINILMSLLQLHMSTKICTGGVLVWLENGCQLDKILHAAGWKRGPFSVHWCKVSTYQMYLVLNYLCMWYSCDCVMNHDSNMSIFELVNFKDLF